MEKNIFLFQKVIGVIYFNRSYRSSIEKLKMQIKWQVSMVAVYEVTLNSLPRLKIRDILNPYTKFETPCILLKYM